MPAALAIVGLTILPISASILASHAVKAWLIVGVYFEIPGRRGLKRGTIKAFGYWFLSDFVVWESLSYLEIEDVIESHRSYANGII